MVSVVKWYLAILCGVVLNMETSEKRVFFSFFLLSLLMKIGLGDSLKKSSQARGNRVSALEFNFFLKLFFRLRLSKCLHFEITNYYSCLKLLKCWIPRVRFLPGNECPVGNILLQRSPGLELGLGRRGIRQDLKVLGRTLNSSRSIS